MRRVLLCCTLLAIVLTGCGSASSTYPSNGRPADQHPYQTAAATQRPPAASWAPPQPNAVPPAGATAYASASTSSSGPYDMTYFQGVGVNPYVDASRDPVSTFGLDVDTASYTVARRFVRDGNRPDPASVRVEEWVNFFDQRYAAPENDTFAVYADGAPTPFLTRGEVLLRVGVKARETTRRERPSAALTFVIDVSGSMDREDRLELVKRSLRLLVGQLRPDDRVAIVAFGSSARIALRPVSGSAGNRILAVLDGLHPEDSTNAEDGLRLGYQLAREQRVEGGINRVVLATDGVANVGNVDAATILRNAGIDHSGIQLVAVGVGMGNYNDVLLEQLADEGDGFYAYVDSLDEARRIFCDELTATLDTVALDAKAQISFEPSVVAAYRLIGYEDRALPDSQFRNPRADGGAIGAGHAATVLYAIRLRDGDCHGDCGGRLATVNLRWTDPQSRRPIEIARAVNVSDLAAGFGAAAAAFKLDATVAATAEVLRGSPWIEGYRLADVHAIADEIANELPRSEDVTDFLLMLDQAAGLES